MPFLETISMFHKIKFSDSIYLFIFQIQKMKTPVFLFPPNSPQTQLIARIFNGS